MLDASARPRSRFSDPLVAASLATFCCLLWGSAYPAIKAGYSLFSIAPGDLASKLLFAGARFVLAGALVLGIAAALRKPLGLPPSLAASAAGLGLLQTSVQYAFFYAGLGATSGAKASVVNSSQTFFTAVLAHFLYADDRLTARKALGCLAGFVGVVLVNWSGDILFDWRLEGEGFIAVAALILSAASLWGRRLSARIDPMVLTGWQLSIGGAALGAAGLAMGGRFGSLGLAAWLDLGYLALLSAAAFTIWTFLLLHNKVTGVAIFYFVIPVSGVLLSGLFLGESILEPRYAAALAAVSAGIALVNLGSGRAKGRAA